MKQEKGIPDLAKMFSLDFWEAEPFPDAIQLLKADHKKVQGLFRQYDESGDKRKKLSIIADVVKELKLHSRVEEELVYPLLQPKEATNEIGIEEALEEHSVVDQLVAELDGQTTLSKTVQAKMSLLQELVRHHIKEEERNILPQLEENGINLTNLGERIRYRKETILKQAAHRTTKRTVRKSAGTTKRARTGSKVSRKRTTRRSSRTRSVR